MSGNFVVVRGNPTDEEVAAVTVALRLAATPQPPAALELWGRPPRGWRAASRALDPDFLRQPK